VSFWFYSSTWQADEKGMELTWMFCWVFKRNSAVVDACLQMANEAVSKYHYPSLVVGNLVTIPKSGEDETKNDRPQLLPNIQVTNDWNDR
jgi:uncharacterized Fe-S cluster-containing radical SAM superfamily protein